MATFHVRMFSPRPRVNRDEICLIDCDNIRYQSAPQNGDVYTVGYGAPEVVVGRSGVNSLSEAFAFAVLAFQMLAATHPLIGDFVHDGEPEHELAAFEGKLPWIEDPTNDMNRSRFGLDREIVLSPRLKKLFEETFGPGLNNPMLRPGIARWLDALHTAADATISVPNARQPTFRTKSAALGVWRPDRDLSRCAFTCGILLQERETKS